MRLKPWKDEPNMREEDPEIFIFFIRLSKKCLQPQMWGYRCRWNTLVVPGDPWLFPRCSNDTVGVIHNWQSSGSGCDHARELVCLEPSLSKGAFLDKTWSWLSLCWPNRGLPGYGVLYLEISDLREETGV